jgi:septum formation protein
MTPAVVLASASPARRSVLQAAGIDPVVLVSGVDEDAIVHRLAGAEAADVVVALAAAKAQSVAIDYADHYPDAVVIGCDSMLHLDARLLGKPHTADEARRRWAEMAGREGDLLTGHAVVRVADGTVTGTVTGICRTTVRFGSPTEAELAAYIDTGEPLAVAGAFTIDGLGGWFVDGVDGDPSSVIGISLPLTRSLLARHGLAVTDLWNHP